MNRHAYEPETIYHLHARRYLREAGGDKRAARREVLNDKRNAPDTPDANFYDAVLRIIEAQS